MKHMLVIIATVLVLSAGFVPTAQAVQCAAGVKRAGCVGPNGAVGVGPNGAAAAGKNGVHTTTTTHPPAGTTVHGVRGNSATKAVQPGCAYVNGKRVCR
jgi:hypothetical protein